MFEVDIDFAGVQSRGDRVRQEDAQSFAAIEENADGGIESLLLVLADGMGGEQAGLLASQTIVQTFVRHCLELDLAILGNKVLLEAMDSANQALADLVLESPGLEGMGATLVAVLLENGVMHYVSVGDSLLYLYRDNRLVRLNEDHSMLPVLNAEFQKGEWSAEELENHPERHLLRSAIIGSDIELVDCPKHGWEMKRGDILIVASDGIETLSEEDILACLEKNAGETAERMAESLLGEVLAIQKPRQDNTSINVIQIP